MSYQIITDSCCDFTEAMYREQNVLCVPLTVTFKGESHTNFSDEAAVKAFYDELRCGVTATTSAANPDDWCRVVQPVLQEGRDILILAFSSGLSTTYSLPSLRQRICGSSIQSVPSMWWIPWQQPLGRACWCGTPVKSGTKGCPCRSLPSG